MIRTVFIIKKVHNRQLPKNNKTLFNFNLMNRLFLNKCTINKLYLLLYNLSHKIIK